MIDENVAHSSMKRLGAFILLSVWMFALETSFYLIWYEDSRKDNQCKHKQWALKYNLSQFYFNRFNNVTDMWIELNFFMFYSMIKYNDYKRVLTSRKLTKFSRFLRQRSNTVKKLKKIHGEFICKEWIRRKIICCRCWFVLFMIICNKNTEI